MLPQLADLDVEKLSPEARKAFIAAHEIYVEGKPAEQVLAEHGLSADELQSSVQRLAAEWKEHSGIVALPKLSEDEYDALRDSIAAHGQLVAILADLDGSVIDGRARLRACRELGIEPRIDYLTDPRGAEELKSLALVVNLARRQLASGARRGIVRDELLRDASRSDRAIGAAVGVSHPTVASVRRELEQQGALESLSTRVGRNGIARPATQPAKATGAEAALPDGLVDVTLRITRDYAAALDGGKWLDCRAVRLVLVAPGTYTLEVRP